MGEQGNKKTKTILVVLVSLLVVIIAVVAFVMVRENMKEEDYRVALEEGDKYMASEDYEQAILHYQKAIELAPEEEEAYLLLADV